MPQFRDPQTTRRPSAAETEQHSSSERATSLELSWFIFGLGTSGIELRDAYPSPVHAFTLWQAYLQNVNPLSKVIYAPHVQDLVVEASRDLSTVPYESVALLFAIYAAAVMSCKDEECQSKIGESKKALHDRYLAATQQALTATGFINSVSLVALQAFAIFLVSCAPIKVF
jgi:hypothetical protein